MPKHRPNRVAKKLICKIVLFHSLLVFPLLPADRLDSNSTTLEKLEFRLDWVQAKLDIGKRATLLEATFLLTARENHIERR